MTRLELSIAWRYLRSRRDSKLFSLISVIAIGGVIVGVSALIVIIGVMNGLQNDLREKILVGSPDIRVLPFGDDMTMVDWQQTLEIVRKQPGVVAAAPFIHTQAVASAGHRYAEGVMVVGIQPESRTAPKVTTIRETALHGDFRFASGDGKQRGVVLGRRVADRFGVFPGDKINLIGFGGTKINAATGAVIPQLQQFEVTGIFETGMYEYDNQYVYMALPVAQEFAGLGTAVTGIEARTPTRWEAPTTAERLATALAHHRVLDWQEQNASLFQALKLEKLGMGIILLLIVVVAAFNIVSTLTMVVADKTREIGILKAMGMTARSIRNIFFTQGVVIGIVGTGLGLMLGIAGALALGKYKLIRLDPAVYFIDHLPVALEPLDVAWIVLASLAIAAVATVHPAMQAAKLYPVDAIRHE
ncbi:MAG TPA: ABC transporter permease [Gemmatimonadaceae bacterium]|nr:ABC transporter permease [Gemmatimonadaceae bacterium]